MIRLFFSILYLITYYFFYHLNLHTFCKILSTIFLEEPQISKYHDLFLETIFFWQMKMCCTHPCDPFFVVPVRLRPEFHRSSEKGISPDLLEVKFHHHGQPCPNGDVADNNWSIYGHGRSGDSNSYGNKVTLDWSMQILLIRILYWLWFLGLQCCRSFNGLTY